MDEVHTRAAAARACRRARRSARRHAYTYTQTRAITITIIITISIYMITIITSISIIVSVINISIIMARTVRGRWASASKLARHSSTLDMPSPWTSSGERAERRSYYYNSYDYNSYYYNSEGAERRRALSVGCRGGARVEVRSLAAALLGVKSTRFEDLAWRR